MKRALALVGMVALLGCDTPVPPPNLPLKRDKVELETVRPALIDSATGFALNAAAKAKLGEDGKNDCLSPYSLDQALVMLLNGAEGETYDTLAKALGVGQTSLDLVNRSRMAALDRLRGLPGPAVTVANSIWMIQPYPVNHQYAADMETFYGATVKKLGSARVNAVRQINAWVNAKTLGRIPRLYERLGSVTEVVLVNTVTLDATWKKPFPPSRSLKFETPGGPKLVPTLSSRRQAGTSQGDTFEALRLDFAEGELSMLFLLPREGKPGDLFASFDAKALAQVIRETDDQMDIEVQIPKFHIEARRDLQPLLTALGCGSLYSGGNDFSNISLELKSRFLSDTVHSVWMEVDERGARAAAATGIGIGKSASRPSKFKVDRPFAFLVVERSSRAVILAGVVNDPSQ
jgi:serpin B